MKTPLDPCVTNQVVYNDVLSGGAQLLAEEREPYRQENQSAVYNPRMKSGRTVANTVESSAETT